MEKRSARTILIYILRTLLIEILVLMALGAFVRAMNAGLSCPDWPLCFGKVIPDFHPGVWYEFIHRADAGLVAITYLAVFFFVMFSKKLPGKLKPTAISALLVLLMLISAGAMTVLKQVAWLAVTTHLMLATTFYALVLRLSMLLDPRVEPAGIALPSMLKPTATLLVVAVFCQILLGGVVASTYAGSVCVDWPYCNGQWVPTWQGAIGHQIMHRFLAYAITLMVLTYAIVMQRCRRSTWMTSQLMNLSRLTLGVVCAQVILGIANLLFFIPPWLTVPHQTVAIILLGITLRLRFVVVSNHHQFNSYLNSGGVSG